MTPAAPRRGVCSVDLGPFRILQIQVEEPVVIGTSTAISTKDPHALLKIHDSAVPEQWLRYIAIGSHQSPILRLHIEVVQIIQVTRITRATKDPHLV